MNYTEEQIMTIDEAINHCHEVANRKCDDCGKEHLQLARWLEQLVEAKKYIKHLEAENEKLNSLCNLPTTDVEEVRHGEWKPRTGLYYDYYCSNCDGDAIEYESSYGSIEYHLTDYCYHCGAKMDGEKKDKE